jgi:transcriptional regulator with XRE-family HTH domain
MQIESVLTQTKPPPLRAVRQARGMSLRQAAASARLDPGHLSRVERGEASLSIEALTRLAGVLGLRELEGLLGPYAVRDRGAAVR